MGLDLTSTPVISKKAAGKIKDAMDILRSVQEKVRGMGLPEYPQPEGQPPPLANLNPEDLTNRDLERYYTSYVAYAMYIAPKVAEAEAAYKISTSNLRRVAIHLEMEALKQEIPKSEIKARVQNNPEWIDQELEHLKLYATKTILEAHCKAYGSQAKALSRIIELRKLEFESQQRGNSIGSHKSSKRPGVGTFARPR